MTAVTSFVYTLMQGIGVIGGMIPLFLLLFGTAIAGVLAGDGEMSEDAVIMMIPAMFIGYLLMFVVMIFICAPLTVGYSRVHLDLIDGKPVDIGSIFSYFKKAYWKSVKISYYRYQTLKGKTEILAFVTNISSHNIENLTLKFNEDVREAIDAETMENIGFRFDMKPYGYKILYLS